MQINKYQQWLAIDASVIAKKADLRKLLRES